MKIRNERLAAVAAGAAILVGIGSVTAVAADLVTSKDIKNDTIKSVDVRDDTLTREDISDRTERSLEGQRGPRGPKGEPGEPAVYQGVNWSVIDRNVIGNGDAYLRAGPSAGPEAPPSGVGSLGLRTGAPTDKAAFGNQVDFVGDPLAGIDTVKYWVFTTGENAAIAANNLPSVAFEVDPTGPDATGPNFSTLVFTPETATPNAWTELDASTEERWYYTGAAGTASGCNQTTYCTLAEAKAAFPDATVLSAQVTKGRDYAFSGAVDGVTIDETTYDFEPFGVVEAD
ncbi:hypothetical protein [Nocardioides sp.]|uniref:hypothetical protein n=1 Tax=Nocardioides sp. TaxID=35761 RepID=UPI002ED66BE5